MRLPVFKGLDGTMPISTWLRAVQTEARRQERTLGLHWNGDEVYFEMVSHLEGEALRWYGNIISSITDETDENLARLLRGRYGEQRSDPEVVGSLNDRKQMRGEPLVEYAAVLRAIVGDRNIGEEWLIDAFLNGMGNQDSATHVRGRQPTTLDEAVRDAIRQVGKFGEGHRVRPWRNRTRGEGATRTHHWERQHHQVRESRSEQLEPMGRQIWEWWASASCRPRNRPDTTPRGGW
jgi:hypothetical protein